MNDNLTAALTDAKRGWRLLPVAGKVSTLKDWPTQATADPGFICTWWTEQSSANIGNSGGKLGPGLDIRTDGTPR